LEIRYMSESVLSDPATWVDEHGDPLFRFAMTRLKDRDTAEELVQETFLAALKAKDSFKGRSSERTWLIGILKNKIIDHFRKQAKERPISEQGEDQVVEEAFTARGWWKNRPKAWAGDPSKAFSEKEFWQVFAECLANLPERLGRVFTLREMDDMPTEKVCKVLNLTQTNLWVILHRARMRLRACLESNWFRSDKGSN
jgi:RNA polymerase sigma-70 factor (ECF subfamily)